MSGDLQSVQFMNHKTKANTNAGLRPARESDHRALALNYVKETLRSSSFSTYRRRPVSTPSATSTTYVRRGSRPTPGWLFIQRFLSVWRSLMVCIVALFALSSPAFAETRIALVIGNAKYSTSTLKNPANDAAAIASALKKLGFVVIHRENATQRNMLEAMREFVDKAGSYDVRLLFYAGHGMQITGKNYLMPVDAALGDERDLQRTAVNLNEFVDLIGQMKRGINIVVLDACRDNPYGANQSLSADGRRMRFRSVRMSGLASVEAPVGSFVAFAAAPGQVAEDGPTGSHGVFTKHLLDHIAAPNLTIEQVFKRVRSGVKLDTDSKQIPWDSSSLTGEFCFVSGAKVCGETR